MSTDDSSLNAPLASHALPNDIAALQRELLQAREQLSQTAATLAETAATCEQQQAQLTKLQEEIELFKRYLFGRRSERHAPDPRQASLPFGDDDEAAAPVAPPPQEEEITYRRRRGHGWSKLPANLEREEVLVDGCTTSKTARESCRPTNAARCDSSSRGPSSISFARGSMRTR